MINSYVLSSHIRFIKNNMLSILKLNPLNIYRRLRIIVYAHPFGKRGLFNYLFSQTNWSDLSNSQTIAIIGKIQSTQDFINYLKGRNVQTGKIVKIIVDNSNSQISKKILNQLNEKNVLSIIILEDDPNYLHGIVDQLLKLKSVCNIPLVFIVSTLVFYKTLLKHNKVAPSTGFIESSFDYVAFNEIYEKSIQVVKKKCDPRDAYDLFYALGKIKNIKGNIIEIGSYQGHSGWLIYNFAKKLRLPFKKLLLCDTFEKFPSEKLGIDSVWSGICLVDYGTVRRLFKNYKEVSFLKGDIRKTLKKLPKDRYSFIHVDVDSYSATLEALNRMCPQLVTGGIVFCEDYGESHCLGARIAIDQYFNKRNNYISFFSFMSGCKYFIKT